MAKLSKKDRNLIYLCAMFAAGALTYMLAISPLDESIERLAFDRDYNQMYLDDINCEVSMADTYQSDLAESKAKYLEDREFFEDVYVTENADRIFTDEVLKNKMTPLSFNISGRDYDKRLEPFGFRGAESGYEAPEYSRYIYMRSISFTCEGTFDRALQFVDELKDRNGIIINSVMFTNDEGEYSDINSKVTLSVSFDIYTYDKEGFAADNAIEF